MHLSLVEMIISGVPKVGGTRQGAESLDVNHNVICKLLNEFIPNCVKNQLSFSLPDHSGVLVQIYSAFPESEPNTEKGI